MIAMDINPSEFEILVCDDESSIRSMLGEALAGWGFRVQTAPSAEAALQSIAMGNIPHVVLSDIRMGGMSGIQLAGEVKKISDEIEVIIMTSHQSFETAVQAMRLGVFDYLSKPFDNINDVRTVVTHVCKRIYMRFYTEYLVRELEVRNMESQMLAETSEALVESLDIGKVLNVAAERISKAFGNSPCIFLQYLPNEMCVRMRNRYPENFIDGVEFSMPVTSPAILPNLIAATDFRDALSAVVTEDQFASYSLKSVPLKTRGVIQGLFCLFWDADQPWSDSQEALFTRYGQLISTSFENALLHAKVTATAIRDGLTGLFNVRYFKNRLQEDLKTYFRNNQRVSFLFLDVDHFKKYNDTNGHPAGDEALRIVAKLLKSHFRSSDVVARYGGEEFVVAMPMANFAIALKKAEGFRQLVESTAFPHGEKQPLGKVSVSIGVSEYPAHGSTLEEVIKAADDALYEAKKTSRNVVVGAVAPETYIAPY